MNVSFQFGTTTAYGQSTAAEATGPDDTLDQVTAQLTGLPAATTIHYRAVATSDFGTFLGADETLITQSPPPPGPGHTTVGRASVSGASASVPLSCTGAVGATCELGLKLTIIEKFKGRTLIALTAHKHARTHRKLLVVGSSSSTVPAGQAEAVKIALNRAGRHLLALHHHLAATLRVSQTLAAGRVVAVATQTLTLKAPLRKRHHHSRI